LAPASKKRIIQPVTNQIETFLTIFRKEGLDSEEEEVLAEDEDLDSEQEEVLDLVEVEVLAGVGVLDLDEEVDESNRMIKIALASGKGGTGKTMLAVNLAFYLSQKHKTLLVDLDVEEPNDFLFIKGDVIQVSDQYKMIPEWEESKCNLCGICTDVCNYHAVLQLGDYIAVFKELCHSCYACSELCPTSALPMRQHKMGEIKTISSGNLTFIESRLLVGEEQAVPLINQTHSVVLENFDHIPLKIYDCPPGTSCPMVASVKRADFIVLVTEPTPFGLNDLKLAVETVAGLEKPFGVVINRDGIGNNEVEMYCSENSVPVLARIPFDQKIAALYSKGQLVYGNIDSIEKALDQIMNYIENTVLVS
jgi:MinD superfamily P-loop ATPase